MYRPKIFICVQVLIVIVQRGHQILIEVGDHDRMRFDAASGGCSNVKSVNSVKSLNRRKGHQHSQCPRPNIMVRMSVLSKLSQPPKNDVSVIPVSPANDGEKL